MNCEMNLNIIITSRKIIIIALLLQLALIGLIINPVPIVREAVSLFYLLFIPGLLILLILKLKLNFTETILFSVGLSISSIMILGAIFNVLARSLGFERPISEMPLMFLFVGFLLFLCVVCYLRSKNFSTTLYLKTPLVPLLSLWLLPLSIYGVHQLIAYNNNVLLLLLYAIISLFPLLVAFNKVPKEAFSFIIWIMSVSLLYPRYASLNYVSETIMPGVVVRCGFWDPAISASHNSLLFDTIVHPTFFFICGFENILSELKTTLFFISSFIPLILYQLFTKRNNEKIAFMASSLFMLYFWFYAASSPRQKHAELFLALLLLSVFNEKLSQRIKALLSVIFALSLVFSHYGTSYLFMFSLVTTLIAAYICKKLNVSLESERNFSFNFLLLYLIAILYWYMYTAGSVNLITLVSFYNFFFKHLGELFSPEASHALGSLIKDWDSISIEVLKYLMIFICGLIAVGILHSFYRQIKEKKVGEHLVLSTSFLIMLGATLLPIGGGFDTSRIFHITLILLAPFSVIGLKIILKGLSNQIANKHLILFAGLLIIFFLLNCGFVSEVITTKDYSPNAYINKKMIITGDNIQAKYLLYRDYYVPSYDVQASEWIKTYADTVKRIYADRLGWRILLASKYGMLPEEIKSKLPHGQLLKEDMGIEKNSYVFLAFHNTVDRSIFVIENDHLKTFNLDKLKLENMSKVYNNGNAVLLLK